MSVLDHNLGDMQTLGTWLQLSGSIITALGLRWAWHKAPGRLIEIRNAMAKRLTRIREAVAAKLAPPPVPTGATIATTMQKMTTHAEGSVDNGTPEHRFARLETENARRADEVRELSNKIERAREAALEEFTTLL